MRNIRRIPIVTVILLGLNVIGLIYEYNVGESRAMYSYAMYAGALEHGEYLRLIISAFLHYGFYHFVPCFFIRNADTRGWRGEQKVSGSDRKQTIISFQSAGGMIYSIV